MTIPEGVTSVGDYAFYNCVSLTSVTLPASLAIVGESTFENCDALSMVTFGGSEEQWAEISFGNNNAALTEAERMSTGPLETGTCGENLT